MGKKGGSQKKGSRSTKTRKDIIEDQYDDEIDAFHKQRDIVPLDVNDDTDDSNEDDAQPVFNLEGVDDEDDEDEDEDTDDEEESENGLTAKMIRQSKYLRVKYGNVDDGMADDDDDDKDTNEEEKKITWGPRKGQYYNADNVDIEFGSSDDENLKEEEKEVLRLRAEQTASITAADAGLEDDSSEEESDRELTMEEISVKGKKATKSKGGMEIEEIKKDINYLSKEEQMDVVYSSAPEIVGLLSELNDAVDELENKINPVMSKLKEGEILSSGGTRYLEVKQLLLLTYCQSITFYLLLKSEGQPVRDHPVLARLVDIKGLLDQIKEVDGNLPPGFEESLVKSIGNGTVEKVVKEDALSSPVGITEVTAELVKIDKSRKDKKKKGEKRKHQVNDQSEEMLKLRAALEGKLRSNGVLGSTVSKSDKAQKRQKLANRKLETFDDYVDDEENTRNDVTAGKLTKLVSTKRKPRFVTGDDDLPQRDDIGERRRKFELRVLAGAGVKSEEDGKNVGSDEDNYNDDDNDMVDDDDDGESEDEFYKQEKKKQLAKRAAKAGIYSRTPSSIPSLPESVDGKRLISREIINNRGLTRQRNKDRKNPRKNNRLKHEDKVKRRRGQVRDIRKQEGHYGGEAHGINPYTSKSIRIKN